MFLRLEHCSCKYYKTLRCIIVLIDEEEKKFRLKKKKDFCGIAMPSEKDKILEFN